MLDRDTYKLVHKRSVEIKMGRGLFDYRGAGFFDESYFPEDADGNKYVEPGLVCAWAAVANDVTYGPTYRFVPYTAGASYGVGSDTPYGLLDTRLNATLGGETMAVLYHGQVQQRLCYVLGGAKGTISNTIKTALADIDWV
jgi:hypothetical protein